MFGPSVGAEWEHMFVSNARLADEITALAAHINAATCRWLELIAEFDRREAWADWGMKSCAHWISWRCALAPGPAREHLRVARRLEELPQIRAAFGRGELSYSKVRALTRVENVEEERALLEMAEDATASQLERIIQAYRGVVRAEDAQRAHEERSVSLYQLPDGTWSLRGTLTAEDGALLARALDAARDELRVDEPDAGEDVPAGTFSDAADPGAARNADALAHIAEAMLAGSAAERTGGDRYQVVVHVADEGVSIGERGPLRRDPCCRFPGCTQRRGLDGHHIQHWIRGGQTALDNLVHLCRHHHRMLHEGGFTLEQKGSSLTFRTPGGQTLPAAPRGRRGDCETLRRRRQHVTAQTLRLGTGERFDLGMAVDGVIRSAPP